MLKIRPQIFHDQFEGEVGLILLNFNELMHVLPCTSIFKNLNLWILANGTQPVPRS